MRSSCSILLALTLLAALPAAAQIIVPPPENPRPPHPPILPPPPREMDVSVESLKLDVTIREGVATTFLHEVLRNRSGRTVQAQFVLPIPNDAVVHSAALKVGDEWIEAEVLQADEARRAYEDIVRRSIDPALVEYLDRGMLRTRVFPIEAHATRELQLTLSLDLVEDFGTWQYDFPLRACVGASAPRTLTVTGEVESERALDRPYSPTHDIASRVRDEGQRATFSLEGSGQARRDLRIFLPTRGERLTVTAISTRPRGEDGYALLRISPGTSFDGERPASKSIVFALDTSGSMQGEKIEQARQALRTCLQNLGPEDRFAVVAYEASVQILTEGLVPARDPQVRDALAALDRREARGGTNIGEALATSLDLLGEVRRGPAYLLLLTDGLPTVGERDIDALLAQAQQENRHDARIFTFGVGIDVNPRLLDQLARDSRAVPRYVLPGEDLEVSLSNLYAQIAEPLWTDLALELEGAGWHDVVPAELGDLFRGQSLTVVGRYRDGGRVDAVLRGERDGRRERESFGVKLAERSTEHAYVAQLWASRKIAQLQSEVRAHGADPELIDEIVRLGTRYGIVTEYTSLLMREDDIELARDLRDVDRTRLQLPPSVHRKLSGLTEGLESKDAVPMAAREGRAMQAESVADSPYDAFVPEPAPGSAPAQERQVGRRVFRFEDGIWVDRLAQGATPRLTVEAFSPAYFELLDLRPELRSMLSLSSRVWVVVGEDVLAIDARGEQKLSGADRQWLTDAAL